MFPEYENPQHDYSAGASFQQGVQWEVRAKVVCGLTFYVTSFVHVRLCVGGVLLECFGCVSV